jgi:hypothetical protein
VSIVTQAHLDRIPLGASEQEVVGIMGTPPTARTEGVHGPGAVPRVQAQWLNSDLSGAQFIFLNRKLWQVKQTDIP